MTATIYTIGHSTNPVERLIELLQQHGITAVGDVRSQPYSRMNPQFNREDLEKALARAGIGYVFLGEELGARADDPACYENGKVRYDRLARTGSFQRGLERVRKGAAEYRLALMCAEKEPLDCHRTILVARHLDEWGMEVQHILADGSLEPHAATIERLKKQLKIGVDMFRPADASTEQAYAVQGERIAYQRPADRRSAVSDGEKMS